MNKINEQQQAPLLLPNSNLGDASIQDKDDEQQQMIRTRIHELELELNDLKLQLSMLNNT